MKKDVSQIIPHFPRALQRPTLPLVLFSMMSILCDCSCESEAYVVSTPAMIITNTDLIDFGTIAVGSEATRQLSIINTGSSPLNISAITLEPPDAPFFTLAEAQTILAAGELTLPVQFFPLMPGLVEAQLHILSNANNKEDAVVILKGEAYDGTLCGPCDAPPEDTCLDDNNALVYEYAGTCVDGSCLYESTVIPCPYGCDATTGRCLPPECTDNADCDDERFCNGVETCDVEAGLCVYAEAPCSDEAPICDEDLDQCLECRFSDDCNDETYCNGQEICTAEHECVSGTAPCSGATPICIEASQSCVACLDDADCLDDDFCNGLEYCKDDGFCGLGPLPCTEALPFCDEERDMCGECRYNSDCSDALYCNGQEICNDEMLCENGIPPCGSLDAICDENTQTCGECLTDADCRDTLFCNGEEVCGTDLICQAGSSPCPAAAPICDEVSDSCWVCGSDTDCDNGVFCDGAEICGNDHTCVAGTSPCSDALPFCIEADELCVECLEDADCTGEDTCESNVCVAPGDCDQVGLTWMWKRERNDPDITYVSCQGCNPYGASQHYNRDRSNFCTEVHPILCIKVDGSPAPGNLSIDEAKRWTQGHLVLTEPVQGCALTSLAVANNFCKTQFTEEYRMAEHHDAVISPGWAIWGHGHLRDDIDAGSDDLEYWLHINNQPGNCWNSSAP